jgi:transposase
MFWGGFCWSRRSSLTPLLGDPSAPKGGVSGNTIRALYEEILPTICEPGSIFLQDNASVHTSHVVKEFLSEFSTENGVTILDWPPYSPDLNPIENVWHILKEAVYKKSPELGTLVRNRDSYKRLVRVAVGCWEEIKEDVLKNLVKTMHQRLAAVIRAKGWYTKY